jgi:hypothetical protein
MGMFLELGLLALFIVIVVIFFLMALFFWGLKYAIAYAINAVIGFFALYAIQAFLWPDLVINFWSVAIVAVFGLAGFIVVLLLHWIGWFF